MSLAQPSTSSLPLEQFRLARDVILAESAALEKLSRHLPSDFSKAVDCLCECQGSVIVTGIGKAGWIAQKISATMASTGTRSHYLHPSEAMHGDLGRIGPDDIVLVFSNSGETGEVLQLIPAFQNIDVPLIAIVGSENSSLARASSLCLAYGKVQEACPLGLAPSTSTTLMLALGDALALVTSRQKGFRPIDFARNHPGGSLGRKLSSVDEVMRPLDACRLAGDNQSVRDTLAGLAGTNRRAGAVLLTNWQGELTGIFTDSDLARMLGQGHDQLLDQPIAKVMTVAPKTVCSGARTTEAVDALVRHNISELPVVDRNGKPVGMIDITDVISLLPRS